MIYTRGIQAKDQIAIIYFIFQRQAVVYQEDNDEFLALAEELEHYGLVGFSSWTNYTIESPLI